MDLVSHLNNIKVGGALLCRSRYILSVFFAVLEVELRALHLLNKHFTTCAKPPALFALVYFFR
jgi:hypothetical protein